MTTENPWRDVSYAEAMLLLMDDSCEVETRWTYDAAWKPVSIGTMLSCQPTREWRVRKK